MWNEGSVCCFGPFKTSKFVKNETKWSKNNNNKESNRKKGFSQRKRPTSPGIILCSYVRTVYSAARMPYYGCCVQYSTDDTLVDDTSV